MNKKTIAIILEPIPVVSAVLTITLIVLPLSSAFIRKLITVTFVLALLGFVFFFIGRKLAGEDKAVRVLGILDLLSGVVIVGYYVLAIMVFGL